MIQLCTYQADYQYLIMIASKTYETKFKRMVYECCEGLGYEYNGHKREKGDDKDAEFYDIWDNLDDDIGGTENE